MERSRIVIVAATLALAGCGRAGDLRPPPGHAMPVKPLMARTAPTVNELLKPPAYARPDRVDELVKRSQPRPADPFDLPPPTGGSAPSLPAGTDPGAVTNNSTSATPGD
jgi:predicted small lipoprotein YifL